MNIAKLPELLQHSGPAVDRQLGATTHDCVVIGAGVRLPPKNLLLFETIVNTYLFIVQNTALQSRSHFTRHHCQIKSPLASAISIATGSK